MAFLVAHVFVEKITFHIDKPYAYLVPTWMEKTLQCGCRVLVPFGGGNRKRQGMVTQLVWQNDLDFNAKSIALQLDDAPVFLEEAFAIARFLQKNTFCTFYEAVKTILPRALSRQFSLEYRLVAPLSAQQVEALSTPEQAIITFLKRKQSEQKLLSFLKQENPKLARPALANLIERGFVVCEEQTRALLQDKTSSMLSLSAESAPKKLPKKQQEVVDFLLEVGSCEKKELLYFCAVGESVVKALVQKGVLEQSKKAIEWLPSSDLPAHTTELSTLSLNQQVVFEKMCTVLAAQTPKVLLLHGVTGSGKTQLFLHLIAKTLDMGKQAIMLVPEIALTPQMVATFIATFGDRVAVMHSSLSLTEQQNAYRRIKHKQVDIVVGTRSAIFAPFDNIGLIVLDEEGESSYKSDSSPRYHTREVAKLRCVGHNAVLLLASATPSIESYYFAKRGVYELYSLPHRFSGTKLPLVEIVDMRLEHKKNPSALLSSVLLEEISSNLKQQQQSILFLNRRGFHTAAQCIECGNVMMCKHCDVPLTYHKDIGYMMCHHCGYALEFVKECANCQSPHLKLTGLGTQTIEAALKAQFPTARILRMDADTTHSRYAYEEKFSLFSQGAYDILVGTQMVAKGLDFPNVTLVGVLGVDTGLYAPDYRGIERVFSLITQVVGRSGRAEKAGRAYIQTYQPEHPVLLFAAQQDYHSFYEDEIISRKQLKYPPFLDICTFTLSATNPQALEQTGALFLANIKNQANAYAGKISFEVFGPYPAMIYKKNGKYHEKILMKCHFKATIKAFLAQLLRCTAIQKELQKISLSIDINGSQNV